MLNIYVSKIKIKLYDFEILCKVVFKKKNLFQRIILDLFKMMHHQYPTNYIFIIFSQKKLI